MTKLPRISLPMLVAVAGAAAAQQPQQWDCVIKPSEIIQIGSAAEGILRERSVELGDLVADGQELARLDDTLEALAVEIAALEAEQDSALRAQQVTARFRATEADRYSQLAADSLAPEVERSRVEMEKDLANLGVLAAEVNQSLAEVRLRQARAVLDRRTIRSPAAGIVTEISAAAGEFINEQTVVLTIAVLDVLHVEAFLPIGIYRDISIGDTAVVTLPEPAAGESKATVETIDNLFDTATDTFGVILALPNPDYAIPAGLRCGLSFGVG